MILMARANAVTLLRFERSPVEFSGKKSAQAQARNVWGGKEKGCRKKKKSPTTEVGKRRRKVGRIDCNYVKKTAPVRKRGGLKKVGSKANKREKSCKQAKRRRRARNSFAGVAAQIAIKHAENGMKKGYPQEKKKRCDPRRKRETDVQGRIRVKIAGGKKAQ